MNLQLQPNQATCYATSVAMLINTPVEDLLEELPNPMEIIHPGRPAPFKYRGHHPQDFTIPLLRRGYVLQMVYARIPLSHLYFGKKCLWCGGTGKFKGKWATYDLGPYIGHKGILQYNNHFVAWEPDEIITHQGKIVEIRGNIYDPSGHVRSFQKDPISIQMLHKIQSSENNT